MRAALLTLTWLAWMGGMATTGWAQESTAEGQKEQKPAEKEREDKSDEEKKKRPKLYWDRGLHFVSPGGRWKFKIGGALQNDTAAFVADETVETNLGSLEGDVIWRRARVYWDGTFANHIEYKFMYDFAVSNPPQLKDAYFGVTNLPFFIPLLPLDIRVGRFRAPLSLEGYTGANNTTFMERATISAFLPSRNTGLMVHGDSLDRFIRWNVAFVQEEDDFGINLSRNASLTARFATAFRPKGTLLHLGADYGRKNSFENATFRFLERPESRIAPQFVDTGDFPAEGLDMGILEGAWRRGPLSIQGEYARVSVDSEETGNPSFYAFYVFVSYSLTGESRPYDSTRGTFGRPVPKREFRDASGGLGAFEVAFRFSRIDLTTQGVDGGELNDWTAAFNWYPTKVTRVLFNAILADRKGAKKVGIFQVRMQLAL